MQPDTWRTTTAVFAVLLATFTLGIGPQEETSQFEEGVSGREEARASEISVASRQDVGLNRTVRIPLSGQNLDNVGSISLKIAFDTTALQFEQIANDNSGLSLNASADSGIVTIGGFNTTGTSLGSDFVELHFKFLGGSSNLPVVSESEVTDPQSSTLPVEFADGSVEGDDPTVLIPDQRARSGGTVTVPVKANALREMGSAAVDITYSSADLSFEGAKNKVQGFNLKVSNPQPGVVHLTGSSLEGVDPSDNSDHIVDLQFTAEPKDSESAIQIGFGAGSKVANPSSTPYNVTFQGGRVVLEKAVDVGITGGGTTGLNRTFEATPGDSAEAIGGFRLTAGATGASLDSLDLTLESSDASGINRVALWVSSDDVFRANTDSVLFRQDVSGRSGSPSKISAGGVGVALPSRERYFFVTVSLASDAGGEVTGYIADQSAVTLDGGEIAKVNGNNRTGFSQLPLSAEASALPVELVSFEGHSVKQDAEREVQLVWRTVSETGNAGFQVQRKKVGTEDEWTVIGRRDGAGTTTGAQTYRFTDADLPSAAHTLTYQLRQADVDGSMSTVGRTTVEVKIDEALTLRSPSPNPASGPTTVVFGVKETARVELAVYDMLGKKLSTLYEGMLQAGRTERLSFAAGNLPSGAYFLRLTSGGEARTRKLTVIR